MMKTDRGVHLGLGVYHLAEVSRYTQLSPATIRSWFKGRSDGRGRGQIFDADYRAIGDDFAVSFFDLLDALVAGQLRKMGVPMRAVRAAHDDLKNRLDTNHPFCHSDIYSDGSRIFILTADRVGDEALSEVVSRQQFFLSVKEQLRHVEYSETTQLARRWHITQGIVVDPAICLGKPVVLHTGVASFVLANQYRANDDDAQLVAQMFSVSEADVINAVEFEKQFGGRLAA